MKIYTKTGDKGTTSLLSGKRVLKYNIRIEAYGTVDELNSFIGLLRSSLIDNHSDQILEIIQNKLFNMGSLLAMDEKRSDFNLPEIVYDDIEILEKEMDIINDQLPQLRSFILPGGNMAIASAHICRSICRRAERLCIKLADSENVEELIIVYLNRLSDYFFMLARKIAFDNNIELPVWKRSSTA